MLIFVLKKAFVLLESNFNAHKLHIYRRLSGCNIVQYDMEVLVLLRKLLL
jgi:hypothetical protein